MRNTKFTEIKKMWEEKDFDNFIVAYMPVVQRYAKKIYEDNKLCLSNVEYEDILQDGYELLVKMVKRYSNLTFLRFYQSFCHYYYDNSNRKYYNRLQFAKIYYLYIKRYNKYPTKQEFLSFIQNNNIKGFSNYYMNISGLTFSRGNDIIDLEEFMISNIAAKEAVASLENREKEVLVRNIRDEETLESISNDYDCTRENIRRIRNRALRKVRETIEK